MSQQSPTADYPSLADLYGAQVLSAEGPSPIGTALARADLFGMPLSASAAAFLDASLSKLRGGVVEMTQVVSTLGLPSLTEEQYVLLNNPQAAGAPLVASAVVRALRQCPEIQALCQVNPEQLTEIISKHSKLTVLGQAGRQCLSGVNQAQAVSGAAKTAAQKALRSYCDAQKRASAPAEKRTRLATAFAHVELLESRQKDKKDAHKERLLKKQVEVLTKLDEAAADQLLAEVTERVKAGDMPGRAELLMAAQRYAELTGEMLQSEPARTATRPAKEQRRARKR